MSSLIDDIQTIAKTKLLEEKLSKALSQSDTAINSDVGQSSVQSERSIGVQDGSTNTGTTTNNTTTVQVQGGAAANQLPIPNLGYIPAAFNPNADPNGGGSSGNVNLAALSGGLTAAQEAAQQVAQANAILNQQLNTNNNQTSAIKNINGTDMTTSATTGSTNSSNNTNTTGSDAYNYATNGANDSTLSQLTTTLIYSNSSSSDQSNFKQNYLDKTYNSPGNITADQLQRNSYPPNYNPRQVPLNSIIGFDPNGTISLATGAILAIKLQLANNPNFPVPLAKDAAAQDMAAWLDANIAPTYTAPSYQAGYYWTSTEGASTAFSQTIEGALNAAQSYGLSLLPGGAIYTGFRGIWDPTASQLYSLGQASTFSSLFPGGRTIQYRFNYTLSGTPSFYQVSGAFNKCPGSDPGPGNVHNMCFIGPPTPTTATSWPISGTSIVIFKNGQISYNIYDSELPTYLKSPKSVVRLNCGDGVNVINTNYILVQPAINGGTLVSVYNNSNVFQFANYYNSDGFMANNQMSQTTTNNYIINH